VESSHANELTFEVRIHISLQDAQPSYISSVMPPPNLYPPKSRTASALGDTIQLYAVHRHLPDAIKTVPKRYAPLYPNIRLSTLFTYQNCKKFRGGVHGLHNREVIAQDYDIDLSLIGDVLWKRRIEPEPYLVLVPHGSNDTREWPDGYWDVLALWLKAHRVPFRWLTSPRRDPSALPFGQMLHVLSGAVGAVSIDTGTLHIADGYDIPTIGLYATTSPVCWGPYRYRHLAIDHHRAMWRLDKPYDTTVFNPIGKEAMMDITVDEVIEKIKLVFGDVFNL
jgi:hypothetical protein